jgi:LmbE family N-acetylglucosaminyl deacetylase
VHRVTHAGRGRTWPRSSPGARRPSWRTAAAAVVLLLAAPECRAAETLVVPPSLRVLVVAPHPDDESLAAGGLMQQVLARGGRVHVLFLTDGDGYPDAVEAATGRRDPSASDYRAFGVRRRAEALVALARYGVAARSVTCLGFPDGGLAEIWRRGPQAPAYESPYTRADAPLHADASETGARYRSGDLVMLVARAVAAAAPDWIVLPTPLDNHPDHCATFTFVVAALASLATKADGAAAMPDRLLTYLVHTSRGWPPPFETPGPLPEPAARYGPARWLSLPLDPAEVRTKRAALETHRTQTAVMERLFRSFARPNELFGVLERDALASLTPGTPSCGASASSDAHPVRTPAAGTAALR